MFCKKSHFVILRSHRYQICFISKISQLQSSQSTYCRQWKQRWVFNLCPWSFVVLLLLLLGGFFGWFVVLFFTITDNSNYFEIQFVSLRRNCFDPDSMQNMSQKNLWQDSRDQQPICRQDSENLSLWRVIVHLLKL